jgi:hypothetical protein
MIYVFRGENYLIRKIQPINLSNPKNPRHICRHGNGQ